MSPKSRNYGYSEKESQNRKGRSYGTPEKKNVTIQKPNYAKTIAAILLFPFKLILWILKSITTLWKKSPSMSGNTKKRFAKGSFKLIIALGLAGFLIGTIMVAWISRDLPNPDKLTDRQIAQSTKIYDRTGEHILYEIFSDEKRTLIELEDIPQYVIQGVIATEDTAFYEHKGIRPLSILRALVYGIFTNKRIAGTSTLTQQLVKNAILTDERSITRKIKEAILSIRLEQKYSKDQILKIYFNEIPYGSTNYGIESAAQSYFGKSAKELTLAESATLAGMPKAPSTYLNNSKALEERRNFVLRRMYEEGYITEEQKLEAQAQPLTLDRKFGNIKAPHFVMYVKEQLVEQFGEKLVESGGLKVITTLDWDKQQIAEDVVSSTGKRVLDAAEANNTSLVAMDPKTGQILAMMGSKDFYDNSIDGQFNVATLGNRQPGSSFKPIVYTAAFEKGYTPETVLFDVKTNFAASGKNYTPLNYDLQEHGPVTMRQALQGSLNIPAVKTLYLVGDQAGVEFAERLGYTTLSQGNFGLSLVLGGGEVKLLDHVAAYAVFANEGTKQKPVNILKVESNNGDTLLEWKRSRGDRVLDKDIAATISNVLSDDAARAYAFGAGSILTLPDRPVATKTGTTNAYADAWTIGYTPSLVAGVWAGNTNNTPMKRGYGGSKVAAPIWNEFMRRALENTPVEAFPIKPENDAKKPVLRGSEGGSITLLVNKVTGNRATSSTPEALIVERTYTQAHSILHYVQKDDPRGPVPEDPTIDPQYTIWEEAIQDWIRRKKEADSTWDISFEEPPTTEDDESALALMPKLEVIYPIASTTLFSRQIDTDIRVSSPRGVTKVTYKLDTRFISVEKSHPFNLNYYARDTENGDHTLTIIAEDDLGNKVEKVIPFTLSASEEAALVTWHGDNQTLSTNDFPRTFFLNPFKLEDVETVNIYAQKSGQSKTPVGNVDLGNLFNNQLTFSWAGGDVGTWELLAETIRKDGSKGEHMLRITITN